jgi:methyl coenzyme M reductase alpha subunit
LKNVLLGIVELKKMITENDAKQLFMQCLPKRQLNVEHFTAFAKRKSVQDTILVLASPKTGSTFLTNYIAEAHGARVARMCYAYSSNEHDLYLPSLMANADYLTVSQLHMKSTPHNVQLMRTFKTKNLVLTRNVFDSILSFARDLQKKTQMDHLGTGLYGYSFVWLSDYMLKWNLSDFIDYSIANFLPWYINFTNSWMESAKRIDLKFIQYEHLNASKVKTVTDIVRFCGMDDPVKEELLEKDYLRSSSGISTTRSGSGAGLRALSDEQIDKIRKLIEFTALERSKEFMFAE